MKKFLLTILITQGLLLSSCGGAATELVVEAEVSGDVAVLVVDDFADPGTEKNYGDDKNCIVQPDGQKYGSTGTGLGDEIPTDSAGQPISHGDSVYNDIVIQLGNAAHALEDQQITDSAFPWLKRISAWDTGQGRLILVGVDTQGYTTTSVSGSISSAINQLQSGMTVTLGDATRTRINEVPRFVVNMSFAIIPCESLTMTLNEYNDLLTSDPELATLHDELSVISGSGLSQEEEKQIVLIQRVYQDPEYFSDDPLFQRIAQEENELSIVFVAAAGNKGQYFSYPFAPAKWDFVISVSSEGQNPDVEGYKPLDSKVCPSLGIADYSNCGEIRMNGDSYANKGTSYASPKFSYGVALDLVANKFGGCAQPIASKVLGYANDNGKWLNLKPDEAFNSFCIPSTPTP